LKLRLQGPARARIDTRQYQASHVHTPRGRGLWGFENAKTHEIVWIDGTYTEAREAARRWRVDHPPVTLARPGQGPPRGARFRLDQ